jgi:hypothetical protein
MKARQDVLIDETIDLVARRLTDVEAPAHLRARVLARLDERRAARGLWWLPLNAAAAIAIVVTIAAWPRPHAPSLAAFPAATSAKPTVALAAGALVSDTTPPEPRADDRAARRPSGVGAVADPLEFHAQVIAALDPIDPLQIESIQPLDLAIPLLQVAPLTMPPVTPAGNDAGGK